MPERDEEPGYDPSNPNPPGEYVPPATRPRPPMPTAPLSANEEYYWDEATGLWLSRRTDNAGPPGSGYPPPPNTAAMPGPQGPGDINNEPQPIPTTYGGVPTTGGFNYGGGPTAHFSQPQFSPYESPGPFVPRNATFNYAPFSFRDFKPSSWADAEQEPGYEQSQNRLRKMVENSAAYQGVLRSGMTIGNLDSVLDTNKGQNFAQFDARNFRNYGADRDNAADSWSMNLGAARNKFLDEYGIDKDVYGFRATDVDRGNNYRFNVDTSRNTQTFNSENAALNNELAKWTAMVNSLTQISRPV